MIKNEFKLFLLILLFGFISIGPKARYMVGISLMQFALFLLWIFKYEDRKKWIKDNPIRIPSQKLRHRIK